MKIKYFTLPNIITLCNLLSGCFAALCAVAHIWSPVEVSLKLPLLFIVASAIFDFLDGLSARLTGQYSPLGVQLDSLADMVSFGVVPALTLTAMFSAAGGEGWWWLICLSVALCSALRLARFNIDEEQHEKFIGLPTPALALAIGSLAWAMESGVVALSPSIILAISVVGAWLLISPIGMFSLKFRSLSLGEPVNRLRYLFVVAAAAIAIIGGPAWVWCIIVLYILLSIVVEIAGCCKNKTKRA
ncbi:MAG: CDP-diacylglycerol--serine O-phosphatidyltransferase [Tidjanibacter sp.]|nr:CDP-diacylglycerol--serine O-phosphatidyltransferase [Tidjanibacter sp.]